MSANTTARPRRSAGAQRALCGLGGRSGAAHVLCRARLCSRDVAGPLRGREHLPAFAPWLAKRLLWRRSRSAGEGPLSVRGQEAASVVRDHGWEGSPPAQREAGCRLFAVAWGRGGGLAPLETAFPLNPSLRHQQPHGFGETLGSEGASPCTSPKEPGQGTHPALRILPLL